MFENNFATFAISWNFVGDLDSRRFLFLNEEKVYHGRFASCSGILSSLNTTSLVRHPLPFFNCIEKHALLSILICFSTANFDAAEEIKTCLVVIVLKLCFKMISAQRSSNNGKN